mmetsp:Transcript_139432/g.445992  ORF Transcript_139432/g.445992 Transcript_139432/m.445992 type:complete len:227 (+) Transcript_139432:2287-2967(+)
MALVAGRLRASICSRRRASTSDASASARRPMAMKAALCARRAATQCGSKRRHSWHKAKAFAGEGSSFGGDPFKWHCASLGSSADKMPRSLANSVLPGCSSCKNGSKKPYARSRQFKAPWTHPFSRSLPPASSVCCASSRTCAGAPPLAKSTTASAGVSDQPGCHASPAGQASATCQCSPSAPCQTSAACHCSPCQSWGSAALHHDCSSHCAWFCMALLMAPRHRCR